MAYNYEYPYGDTQMFNIDWALAKIKELEQAINVDTYKYIGENVYTDWNQAQPQTITYIPVGSLALNQAMEGASGLLFTNGNSENLEQRFYAFSSGDRWYRSSRNGVWLMWSNKDDDSSYLKGLPQSSTFNANNAEPNTYLYAYGNPANFPSGVSAGMIVNYQTNDSGLLQIVYPTVGTDTWKRIKTSDGVFGQWMNVNDYSSFYHLSSIQDIDNMDGKSWIITQSTKLPVSNVVFLVLEYSSPNTVSAKVQFAFPIGGTENWYVRYKFENWNNWIEINQNNLHLYVGSYNDANDILPNTWTVSSGLNNSPIVNERFLYIFFGNYPTLSRYGMQLAIQYNTGKIFTRYKIDDWSAWTSNINTTALLSTQHTYIYSTALSRKYNTMSTEETKGSSFMHSDEGYKSFADAIMESDLSDKDIVITNLEMWDMDTPVNELTAKVSEIVAHIKETSPLTGFTLYSLPPIDVPFFGDELYDYVWPSGNTLTQVDSELISLAEKMGFKYITWREYKHINDNNLLSLYDDLFNNDLYKHSLQSYIENTI